LLYSSNTIFGRTAFIVRICDSAWNRPFVIIGLVLGRFLHGGLFLAGIFGLQLLVFHGFLRRCTSALYKRRVIFAFSLRELDCLFPTPI